MKDITPSKTMLYISLSIFVILFIYFLSSKGLNSTQFEWFIRVIVALSAGAMSMSLSGTINIGKGSNFKTLAEESPNVTAAGALAVFAIVYLLEPGILG